MTGEGANSLLPDDGRVELVGFELVRALLPLRKPWASAAGSFSERDSLLVRAVVRERTDAGAGVEVEGWGECTALPDPSYSAEYTSAAVAVSERYIVPALIRARVGRASDVGPALMWVKGHKMAKAAFEAALLDAQLRAADLRMADFLAALSTCREAPKEVVAAGVAVGLAASLGELLDEVEAYAAGGYPRVKLKIVPGWDHEPVAAVRRRWPELVLFADANGSYGQLPSSEAAARLAGLDRYGLACIEQPLGDDDLAGHAELARRLETPICLDEALTSASLVGTALDMGACAVVNIKAGRLGGFLEAVRVHDLCAERRVPVWCGGMVETGVGLAANVALAALPNFLLPGDLSASSRFFEADLAAPLDVDDGGTIRVPVGAGNGVIIDQVALDRFSTWRRWCPAG